MNILGVWENVEDRWNLTVHGVIVTSLSNVPARHLESVLGERAETVFVCEVYVVSVGRTWLVVETEVEEDDDEVCCTACDGRGIGAGDPCWDCQGTGLSLAR
jgi:hypothetical protein